MLVLHLVIYAGFVTYDYRLALLLFANMVTSTTITAIAKMLRSSEEMQEMIDIIKDKK